MKLSELIPHTSTWLGIPETVVTSVTRSLRPAGLLTSGGRGPGGATMSVDDKINLLLGVCGVEVANRAADHVRIWRKLFRVTSHTDDPFAFTKSTTVKDFFVDLITQDLNGGALERWLKEDGAQAGQVVLDFYVDAFAFTIVVSRLIPLDGKRTADPRKVATQSIEVRFIQAPPGSPDVVYGLREQGYKAGSTIIRRLNAENIRGWGACLIDNPNDQ